jgi:purine-nucleoside phosphorylase
MTHHEWEHVQDAARRIRAQWSGEPRVGIVLGTGLGALAREIEAEAAIPYPEIPFFPRSTVESHKGQLVCGKLAGQSVMAMEGRFHYEGYSPWQVTFRRVMRLGCLSDRLNACGG